MNTGKMSGFVCFFLKRKWILFSLCIITLAGFLSKYYSGPGHKWFNDYSAGLLYEVFWCLVVFFFIPLPKYATPIAMSVFVVTCMLEILQLWHPWFLQQMRSTFLGKTVLGTTFVWWDFPHYVIGSFIGWVLIRKIPTKFILG